MASSFVTKIVGKVFNQTEVKRQIARKYRDSHTSFPVPFITIARDPGSGGKPIGQEVASRLGFQFYDQEILEEIAKSTKLRRDVLKDVDEKSRTMVQDFVHGILNPDYVSDLTFLKHLSNVIATLAYKGNAVILGRGACHLTPKEKGLHIRITAPLEVRLSRAIEYEGHSPQKAKEVVQKFERERRDFVKQYFGENIRNAELYDLTINTESLSASAAADLIVKAFFDKFPSAVPKVKQFIIRAQH